jgi:hypothetical protein
VSGGTDSPRRVDGFEGAVERGSFGAGSKSERIAIWIDTAEGRFVLRRKNGPSFGDKALEKYVGKRVKCNGFIVGYMLLAERIAVVS